MISEEDQPTSHRLSKKKRRARLILTLLDHREEAHAKLQDAKLAEKLEECLRHVVRAYTAA